MKRLILLTVLLCILASCAAFFLDSHIWAAGQFISKDTMELDLRSNKVSIADVRKLSEALPGCEILWEVPFQGGFYSADTQTLTVRELTMEDVSVLNFLSGLRTLEAEECRDYEALAAFHAQHPYCKINFNASLSGKDYPSSSKTITVSNASMEELNQQLPMMHGLTKVNFQGQLPSALELSTLAKQFEAIAFDWPVAIGAEVHSSTETALDLSGLPLTRAEAEAILDNFPYLVTANMHGCGIDRTDMVALVEEYPAAAIGWDVQIGNLLVSTDAEEIDISGQPIRSPAEIEELLPCFPNAKKIVMSQCGLDDETMDTLDKKHEDIRFVWSVQLGSDWLRTDATYFYPFKFSPTRTYNDEQLKALKYCRELIAVDISRMTMIKDCTWLESMPNLKYLSISESGITDISPLASLKKLVFLEMFTTKVTDYAPLAECTALEDLNLGNTFGDPAPIAQMTWLKNVWWSGVHGTFGKPCSNAKAVLEAALPNTTLRFNLDTPNINNGWRQLQNYKNMRDVMEVFYLN